jgi:hypothetical protein
VLATTTSSEAAHEHMNTHEQRKHNMNTTHTLKRIIAGALLSGSIAVAGLGLAAGTAQAEPGIAPQFHGPVPAVKGPYQWCPGDPLPYNDDGVVWDMSVCHTWYGVDYGFQANRGQFVYEGDSPPANLGCIPFLCLPGL